MPSVNDLIGPKVVEALATTSNARLGRELFDDGEVETTNSDASRMEFRVGGKTTDRRRVELMPSKDGLEWKCTCTNNPELFCKHLVAAALSLTKPSA